MFVQKREKKSVKSFLSDFGQSGVEGNVRNMAKILVWVIKSCYVIQVYQPMRFNYPGKLLEQNYGNLKKFPRHGQQERVTKNTRGGITSSA